MVGWRNRLLDGLVSLKLVTLSQQYTARGPAKSSVNINRLNSHMNNLSEITPGLSQPVWGPEIDTVGAYSREGYTARPFDLPAIPFKILSLALQTDEDAQYTINKLAAQVTGGEHYIKTASEPLTEYLSQFSKDLNFDTFDTILIKELLWYGNSIYKPRLGINHIRSADDLMHIPISSFQRIWWDRQRIPYKYEFRGAEYQGYHNPGELLVFNWNPVDASLFGTGFGTVLTAPRDFEMILNGDEVADKRLPSLLDRKYATQFLMQMSTQRYVPRNVWTAPGATEEERQSLEAAVNNLDIGVDIVAGTKVEVEELGTNTRSFEPSEYTEMTAAPIRKALHDFSTKQAGDSTHTFANADTAKEEGEIGMSSFIIHVKTQLENKLFRPWYEANPEYEWTVYGLQQIPWKDLKFDLNFGEMEKKDLPTEDMIKLMELYIQTPMPKDPKSLHEMFEKAGLPVGEYVDIFDDMSGQMAMNQAGITPTQSPQQSPTQLPPNVQMGGGNMFDNMNVGSPPMDNPIYDSMAIDMRGIPLPTNFRRSNQSQDWNTGRNYE